MVYWKTLGIEGTGLASFVNNLLTAGKDSAAAIKIQDGCALHLPKRWALHIGDDSREYLICKVAWTTPSRNTHGREQQQ